MKGLSLSLGGHVSWILPLLYSRKTLCVSCEQCLPQPHGSILYSIRAPWRSWSRGLLHLPQVTVKLPPSSSCWYSLLLLVRPPPARSPLSWLCLYTIVNISWRWSFSCNKDPWVLQIALLSHLKHNGRKQGCGLH